MTKLNELQNKLLELFELDKTDLDFGIYRVINKRQDQIKHFINNILPTDVNNIILSTNLQQITEEFEQAKKECLENFGPSAFNENGELEDIYTGGAIGKKYLELKEKKDSKVEIDKLESEVYSHLLDFFSRYYQDGDFISQRRSAIKDKYAIPYNGEEVVMHWANKDQYYIKSSELLKDYTFQIKDKKVKFRLAGTDAVKDNNRAKRLMVLYKDKDGQFDDSAPVKIEVEEDSLVIPFYFKAVKSDKKTKQYYIDLEKDITDSLNQEWKELLTSPDDNFTGKDKRTIIGKHLITYTKKQTSDFFIHKDLGAFLNNELDFFIKNEVMYLDDVVNKPADYLSSEIRKIKAIRSIAQKIITFLAQIENFQKKLWLKKKFIYETNYCFTLDRIPEEFYGEIANNEKQIEEWIKLFSIDKIKGDDTIISFKKFDKADDKTKVEFLKQNKFLVLDTAFFKLDFKYQILSKIDNLDEGTDGLLIHSENFQALNLLQTRYKEKVKCIYIDPPYNTNASEIAYKNGYKNSSWLSFMKDRLILSKETIRINGFIFIAIDDLELFKLNELIESIYSRDNFLANVSVIHKPEGRNQEKFFGTSNEYMLVYAKNKDKAAFEKVVLDKELEMKFTFTDTHGIYRRKNFIRLTDGKYALRESKPGFYYPIYVSNDFTKIDISSFDDSIALYPITTQGIERTWKTKPETFLEYLKKGNIECVKENGEIIIFEKLRENQVIKTHWTKSEYHSYHHGTKILENILGNKLFDFPKSIYTIIDTLKISTRFNDYILDYFAGSGTTGHAVVNLNREDGGKRKYIMVEMGDYFDTVTKPRMQKVVYSTDWDNGKPTTRDTGISHCFKYIRLESYEDTLNNLVLEDSSLDLLGINIPEDVKQDYLINYMLDIESRDSLMDIKKFDNPFDYSLKIHNYETGQAEYKQVDLIETFNYLLGVQVDEFKLKDGYITIEGKNPNNETILIIWRDVAKKDNNNLTNFLTKNMRVNPADTEYRAIYINGDHRLEDPHKKIFNIAEIFNTLMFDGVEV